MQPRLNFMNTFPAAIRPLMALEGYLRKESGLEPRLLELVKLRSSQINGCAYCIDMHTKDARAQGETEQRLYTVSVWREVPFFSDRERAALLWAEHVTLISEEHVPEAVYEQVKQHFTDAEIVSLTLAVIAINAWNRLAISFRTVPGEYQPQQPVSAGSSAS
jgi:AhpD family alkylhydroperoxidase